MAHTKAPAKALTFAQARGIVEQFDTKATVNAARVRKLIPVRGKSAEVIVAEVVAAYASEGVVLPYAFGESTIDTALWVARAWANAGIKAPRDVETDVLDALVRIRRTRAKLPAKVEDRKALASDAVAALKRKTEARKVHVVGGEGAASTLIAALVKADAGKVHGIALDTKISIVERENYARRAGKNARKLASSDEELEDVTRAHDDVASDARVGDEKAEKRNAKGKRASKHERDPLEAAKPGNGEDLLPGAGESKGAAKVSPLVSASVEALIAEIALRLRRGYVPTAREDDAMTRMAQAWEVAVTEHPASESGAYAGKAPAHEPTLLGPVR